MTLIFFFYKSQVMFNFAVNLGSTENFILWSCFKKILKYMFSIYSQWFKAKKVWRKTMYWLCKSGIA